MLDRVLALLMIAPVCLCAFPAVAEVNAEIAVAELHIGPGPEHLLIESALEAGSGLAHFGLKIDGGSETRTAFDLVQVQALWMPKVSKAATLAFGLRRGEDLVHASAGIEAALASWLDAEHYVFVSQRGDLTGSGKLTASFDLSERWRFEPRLALNWSAQVIAPEALGRGLTDLNASTRLRFNLSERADAYVGVVHERLLGGTADVARAQAATVHVTRGVIGFGLAI
ncbi:copper resistance protein B [Novosphingobium kunmingense]|uniref:Copper resistance protein B n=1 Tax=Novosphingobium kunmingense TaxID=1211806 RepID=A0A2N0HKX4_9SPHN|nr:copper resistance protein B [Novosphingobium kunmingense]